MRIPIQSIGIVDHNTDTLLKTESINVSQMIRQLPTYIPTFTSPSDFRWEWIRSILCKLECDIAYKACKDSCAEGDLGCNLRCVAANVTCENSCN